jgi:hypothetical protein
MKFVLRTEITFNCYIYHSLFQTLSVLGQEQFSAALPQRAPVRWRHNTPLNTVVMFVPQQEAWVVERMGKFHRTLEPGVNVLIPVLDRVKYVQSLKEIAIDIPQQSAITIGKRNGPFPVNIIPTVVPLNFDA